MRVVVVVVCVALSWSFRAAASPPSDGSLAACPMDAFECARAAMMWDGPTLDRSCAAGLRGACLASGYRAFRVLPIDATRRPAAKVFEEGCARGEPAACALRVAIGGDEPSRLGTPPRDWHHEPFRDNERLPGLPDRAVIEASCAKDEPVSCLVLTRAAGPRPRSERFETLEATAFGVEPTDPKDAAYLRSVAAACARGGAVACFRAGKSTAVEACRAGVMEGCDALFKPGAPAVSADIEGAIGTWLEARCDEGFFDACWQATRRRAFHAADDGRAPLQVVKPPVGRGYRESDLPPDPPHPDRDAVCALAWRSARVERDDVISAFCRRDEDRRRKAEVWQRDAYFSNLPTWERECLARRSAACVRAARDHAVGNAWLPKNATEAMRFARLGCDGGDVEACFVAATLDGTAGVLAKELVAKGGPDLVKAFVSSPESFRDAPGLRAALVEAASSTRADFAQLSPAFREPFGGPSDTAATIALAAAILTHTEDAAARAFLDATAKDPIHGAAARRVRCLASNGAACDGVDGLLPLRALPAYGLGERRRWPPLGAAIVDGRILVLDDREGRVVDLATGRLEGKPLAWIPPSTNVLRFNEPLGEWWLVLDIELGSSERGPVGLARVQRRSAKAELERREAVDASPEFRALLVPGQDAVLLPVEGDRVVLDSKRLCFWTLRMLSDGGLEVARTSLLDGRETGPRHRLAKAVRYEVESEAGLLVVADGRGALQVLEVATGAVRSVSFASYDPQRPLVPGPGMKSAVTFDGEVTRLWDTSGPEATPVRTLPTRLPWLIDPSGRRLADGRGRILDLATGAVLTPELFRDVRPGEPLLADWAGQAFVFYGRAAGIVGAPPARTRPPEWIRRPIRLPPLPPVDLPESGPLIELRRVVRDENGTVLPKGTRVRAVPDRAYVERDSGLRVVAKKVKAWSAIVGDDGALVVPGVARAGFELSARVGSRSLKAWLDANDDRRTETVFRP